MLFGFDHVKNKHQKKKYFGLMNSAEFPNLPRSSKNIAIAKIKNQIAFGYFIVESREADFTMKSFLFIYFRQNLSKKKNEIEYYTL